MKTLLVVYSYHHNNTQKVAEVFGKVLDAEIKTPQQTNPVEVQEYDLVGFGAGIDSGKHYKQLLDFADQLPNVRRQKSIHLLNQRRLQPQIQNQNPHNPKGKTPNQRLRNP